MRGFSSSVFSAHLLKDTPLHAKSDLFQTVIEIPAGTSEKWEANKASGEIEHDTQNGKKRIVQYLAYPFNYGFLPQTLLNKEEGGDGDPLDIAVLGESLSRGSVLQVRILGVLVIKDRGETDDKVLAVPADSKIFAEVHTLKQLNAKFSGITEIVETFFSNYKGRGKMKSDGWRDEGYAKALIEKAAKGFAKHST